MEETRKSIAWPLVMVLLLIFLVLGGLVAYWVFARNRAPAVEPTVTVAAPPTSAPSATPLPTPLALSTPTEVPVQPATPVAPMTLLLLGIGTRSVENEADAIYVVAVDPTSGAVHVTTFAPGMGIATAGGENRLRWVWRDAFYGRSGDDKKAAQAVADALDLDYGIAVDHYAVLRESSLASVVDALGGLDVDVPQAYDGIAAGAQHFDGQTAWKYVVWIPDTTGVPTDLKRIERQKCFLDALQQKLVAPTTVLKLPALTRRLLTGDVVVTDLPTGKVLDLLDLLKTLSLDQVTVTVVPASS